MSVYTLASLNPQAQGQRPGGVATGHVPQQPNLGLGPNRYVPPTFNWGRGGLDGRQPQYTQMDWNQMQGFYMPQQQNNTFTNPYMQQLQGMLGMFSNQYGGPNRQPTLPQFGSYNPGFGGPTSFYDQMRGGGGGMYGREYDRRAAYEHARQQPDFDWENYGESMDGPRMPYGSNGGGFGGGGMQNPEGYSDRWSLAPSEMRGGNGGFMETIGGGGRGSDPYAAYLEYQQNNPNGTDPGFNIGGPGQRAATLSREQYSQWLRDTASGMYDNMYPDPYTGRGGGMQNPEGLVGNYGMSGDQIGGNSVNPIYANRGGFGGRGGYPQMPQFNPYMLARNNMMGMGFNEMFDPRFAMLFGMGGLGAMRPQGFAATQPQQPPSTANGQKPLAIGGGG